MTRFLRSRRRRVVAIVVACAVLAFAVLTTVVFVKPDLNAPEKSNAIVVLGGNGAPPEHEGIRLALAGYAPNLVFSLPPSETCVPSADPAVRISCFSPNPATTQGEAREIAKLAALHHWTRVIVVMPTTQASRARLRIGRCYPGQVLEVGVDPAGFGAWVRGIIYEWGAMVKALVFQTSC
jgi:hypothetical protein